MELREENLLISTSDSAPNFDATLKGAEMRSREAALELTAKIIKESDSLKVGVAPEELFDFGPDILEYVWASLVRARKFSLAGELTEADIFASGRFAHPGLVGSDGKGRFGLSQFHKSPNLVVSDH